MKGRILVVEDDPQFLRAIKRGLESVGLDVFGAESAGQALEALEQGPIDCIVVDYRLPGANGLEFVRLIRTIDQRVAVVVVTGHDARKVEKECEGLRVWSVLEKPFATTQLIGKVANALELTHLSPEKEDALAAKFDEEATRMRDLRQDLLNETGIWPAGWQENVR